MQTRQLGSQGLTVSAIGYGAMVLEGYYGGVGEDEAVRTIHHALDNGVNFIDSSDAYGNGHNEQLLAKAVQGRRDDAVIATKFGIVFDGSPAAELETGWGFSLQINGRPDYVRKSLDRSLQTLGIDYIDLWYAHYPDPDVPIAETVGAMAEAVRAGKVKYLGLCNVTAAQLREAHDAHPISAVQNEFSLWRRNDEARLFPTLRELGVGYVPWSPLGSGFLTGTVKALEDTDFRNNNPRYNSENLKQNTDRFAPLQEIAADLDVSPAQLALAWILHQGEQIVPIPGTRKPHRILENAAAANIQLNDTQLAQINEVAPLGTAVGGTLID